MLLSFSSLARSRLLVAILLLGSTDHSNPAVTPITTSQIVCTCVQSIRFQYKWAIGHLLWLA